MTTHGSDGTANKQGDSISVFQHSNNCHLLD